MNEFNWEGKELAYKLAQTPSTGTLIPCKEESKNWDTTENLYIEGDNLEVLKLLQKNYFGKVKMIYIDPPYNTGNDFIYNDNFKNNITNCNEVINQNTKVNSGDNGRYHTDWLNMMYPRLKLARNLLRDDGVIFISIDDNEVNNLRKMCNEIFGEENFIGNFIWRGGRRNASKVISTSHEYMIAFSKNMSYCMENNILWREKKKGLNKIYSKVSSLLKENDNDYDIVSQELKNWYKTLPDEDESKLSEHYCWVDSKGVYFASDISRGGGGGSKWNIVNPNTDELVKPPARGYAYSNLDELELDIKNGLIHFNGSNVPCKKRYLKDNEFQLIETVFYKDRRGSSKRLRSLMGGNIFDFPKDENILCDKIESFTSLSEDDIVLDFFSGSATTAHAVIQLNMENKGKRKFIMVQLPEQTDEKSEAHKAGYKNICEIGKERIRRAGDKIVSENKDKEGIENLDIGFKVFKLDYNKGDNKMYNEKLINSITIEILNNKKPKELKSKKKIASINKDADYKVQIFVDDDYNLYYQDNHAFASCESKIVGNKVETTWNSCKCWFKITGLYECRNNHIVDILRGLNQYSEYLYPKNNVADNIALSRLYEQMVNVYLDYIHKNN